MTLLAPSRQIYQERRGIPAENEREGGQAIIGRRYRSGLFLAEVRAVVLSFLPRGQEQGLG